MRRPTLQLLLYFALLALTVWLARTSWSFDLPGWLADVFRRSTPRELYLKRARSEGLHDAATLSAWTAAHAAARSRRLSAALPHREVLTHDDRPDHSVRALRLRLPPGRQLAVSLHEPTGAPVLGELYRPDRDHPVATWDTLTNRLTYAVAGTTAEDLILLLQSLPRRPARYELRLLTTPELTFPVAGHDAGDIQSFWGAPRDGGRRKHEGNDIFAPKRTPLVAVADGRVTRVGNGGLGGKSVWLRDGEGRPLRYYYAHLDEQLVDVGDDLRRGDTLGLVGNTGNARTTPPHLHFGIYQRGATDPFPYLRGADKLPARPSYQLARAADNIRVPQRGNHYLRLRPERNGTVIRRLGNGEEVTGLGATGRFYRVRTAGDTVGFVNFD